MRDLRKKWKLILLAALLILTPIVSLGSALPEDISEAEDKPFRVAYLEGNPYINYAGTLNGLTEGLSELGLVKLKLTSWLCR